MDESISCKVIRGAEAQFANRKKRCPLTPSARQLIQMHTIAAGNVLKILPISRVCIERNSFDFQQMENWNIHSWQYQKGILYGFPSYKEYINFIQDGKCLLCGKPIEQYHHIKPLSGAVPILLQTLRDCAADATMIQTASTRIWGLPQDLLN